MKIKLILNVLKRNNYVFFDKENRLHLSLGSPVGFATTVSGSVRRAILAGNVIDVDGVTGIEVPKMTAKRNELVLAKLGFTKAREKVKEEVIEEIAPVTAVEEVIEEAVETIVEETIVEETVETVAEKPKRSRKKKEDKVEGDE